MRYYALVFALLASTGFCQDRLRTTGDAPPEISSAEKAMHYWKTDAKITYFPELVSKTPPNQDKQGSPDSIGQGEFGDVSSHRFRIARIVDEKTVLLSLGRSAYWLTGCNTKGLKAEGYARVLGVVESNGSIEYPSLDGGTKRGLHLRLLNREETQAQLAKRYIDQCDSITMRDGTILKAFAVANEKGVLMLVDPDGNMHSVKFADVSSESSPVVRKQLAIVKSGK